VPGGAGTAGVCKFRWLKPQLAYELEQLVMEELFTLKSLLLRGDIPGALAIVEELEEMSRDDKINNIRRFSVVLLLHLLPSRYKIR
jgi:hypothetical protein